MADRGRKKGGAPAPKGRVSPGKQNSKERKGPRNEMEDIAKISEEDITNVGGLFKSITNLYGDITPDELATLNNQFHDHIAHVTGNLQKRLEGTNDQHLRYSEFILAKHAFQDICTAEILRYVRRAANPALAEVLTHAFGLHQQLLRQYPRVVANMHAQHRDQLGSLRQQIANSERETMSVVEAAESLDKQKKAEIQSSKSLQEQVNQLRRQKEQAKRDAAKSPSNKGQSNKGQSNKGQSNKGAARPGPASNKGGPASNKGGRGSQKSDGNRSPSPGRPRSRGRGGASSGGRGRDDDDAMPLGQRSQQASFNQSSSGRPRSAGRRGKSGRGLSVTQTASFQRLTAPKKTAAEKAAEEKQREEAEEKRRRAELPDFQRKLTLNQLRALIEEIYSSKQKYNKICEESQLPYETMEQHVYTFLNQKYGLKKIILGWLKGIKEAVQEYRRTDPDVRCFSRILFNELHEDYLWEYHYNLKRKMNQLLYSVIQIENPKVSEQDLSELFQERVNDYLTKEEWIFMIEDIYQHKHDQEILIRRALDVVAADKAKEEKDDPAAVLKPKSFRQQQVEDPEQNQNLLYKDFVKIVLNYQLEGHVRFLSRFKVLWEMIWNRGEERYRQRRSEAESKWSDEKRRNPDAPDLPEFVPRTPGVIDEEDFINLIESLDPPHNQKDIIQLLNEADPFETSKITFSQCVKVLMPLLKELEVRMEHERDEQTEQALNAAASGSQDGGNESEEVF